MINFALIGIGNWGKNYLSTIKAFPNCQIKYICSKSSNKLTQFKSYVTTTNFKDLLKYQDIDGVIIATPGSTHYQIAKEFLKTCFNLLLEKPLTTNYQDSLRLKTLKDASSKVLVGHVYLFDPTYLKAKELLERIGKIKYVSYEIISNRVHSSAVSLLWELGPHPISLLLDIHGSEPLHIQGWMESSNRISMKIRFPDQTESLVKLSWSPLIKKRELTITGQKGSLIYNDLQSNRLTLLETLGAKTKKIYPSYNYQLPLDKELDEFIQAISEDRQVKISDLNFGVKVTKLLELAQKSIRKEGAIIYVNP